jgi:hypothetical protein
VSLLVGVTTTPVIATTAHRDTADVVLPYTHV